MDLVWPDEDEETKSEGDGNRLHDIRVHEVSLVDRPANKRRFLVLKRSKQMAKEVRTDEDGNLTARDNMDLSAFDDETPDPGDEDVEDILGDQDQEKSQDKDGDSDDDGDDDADDQDDDGDDGDDDKGSADAEKASNKILARLDRIDARLDKLEGKGNKGKKKAAKSEEDSADDGDKDKDEPSSDDSTDAKIDKLADTVGKLAESTNKLAKGLVAQAKELSDLRKSRGASSALDLDPPSDNDQEEEIDDWDDMNRHRRQGARS